MITGMSFLHREPLKKRPLSLEGKVVSGCRHACCDRRCGYRLNEYKNRSRIGRGAASISIGLPPAFKKRPAWQKAKRGNRTLVQAVLE